MSQISETSICNQALGWLGQDPITSLEDNSVTADLCKRNYAVLRDAVTEERMWTFATVRYTSESTDPPAGWGQGFQHRIPTDWLAVYRVYKTISDPVPGAIALRNTAPGVDARWVREGEFVIADESTVYMWGLKQVPDVTKVSVLFTQAVAARLAADLAVALTENRELQADMWSLYQVKLDAAAARDGQQGRNELMAGSLLIGSRGGLGG